MKKRDFLKTTSVLASGALITGLPSCRPESPISEPMTNWAGNLTYASRDIINPSSLDEIASLVLKKNKIRALGSRHSFSQVADSRNALIAMEDVNTILSTNQEERTITVSAGTPYGKFCTQVEEMGFALHNLASLPHISVAGACNTATHGSGVNNGCLATGIREFELIRADGKSFILRKNTDEFNGALVGLGSLGIISSLTLNLLPNFQMEQRVYRKLSSAVLLDNFVNIMSSGYSVSLFTDWQNGSVNQVWIKDKSDAAEKVITETFYDAYLATDDIHPVESMSAESCTTQRGIEGKWYERLPHFKMEFTPSAGDELQAEFFVPLEHGADAYAAIESLNEQIYPHLYISEIRTIARDNFWLSPFYNQDSLAIHFTFKPHPNDVMRLIPIIEEKLTPFNVRPHWGKLFTLSPDTLQSRIQKLSDFKALAAEYDPNAKFRNQFVEKNLYS